KAATPPAARRSARAARCRGRCRWEERSPWLPPIRSARETSMPATPAWPPHSLPRLFVDELLGEGGSVTVDGNYLAAVLRLGPGDRVKLFDDRTGEWLAEIVEAGRKRVTLKVGEHLRDREDVPDLWLLFAPVKRGRI